MHYYKDYSSSKQFQPTSKYKASTHNLNYKDKQTYQTDFYLRRQPYSPKYNYRSRASPERQKISDMNIYWRRRMEQYSKASNPYKRKLKQDWEELLESKKSMIRSRIQSSIIRSQEHLKYDAIKQPLHFQTSLIQRPYSKYLNREYSFRSKSQDQLQKNQRIQSIKRKHYNYESSKFLEKQKYSSDSFNQKYKNLYQKPKTANKTPYTQTPKTPTPNKKPFSSIDLQKLPIKQTYQRKSNLKHVASTHNMREKPVWFKSRVDNSPEYDLRKRVNDLLKYQ